MREMFDNLNHSALSLKPMTVCVTMFQTNVHTSFMSHVIMQNSRILYPSQRRHLVSSSFTTLLNYYRPLLQFQGSQAFSIRFDHAVYTEGELQIIFSY